MTSPKKTSNLVNEQQHSFLRAYQIMVMSIKLHPVLSPCMGPVHTASVLVHPTLNTVEHYNSTHIVHCALTTGLCNL